MLTIKKKQGLTNAYIVDF